MSLAYILHGLLREMMQEISCENFNSRLAKNPFQEKQKNCQINKQIGQLGRKLFPKNAIEMI